MAEIESGRNNDAEVYPDTFEDVPISLATLPYIAALALAVAGIVYTNASQQPLVDYCEILALAIGVGLRHQQVAGNRRQGGPLAAALEPGVALDCRLGRNEYRPGNSVQQIPAGAGHQPSAADPVVLGTSRASVFYCRKLLFLALR
ncbi:hypothetical protein [Bradyrhizobium sp. USDA 4486]